MECKVFSGVIDKLPPSPLERILGFKCSEEIYDTLPFKEQLILDLLIMDWNQTEIAEVMEVSQTNISIALKRIRPFLANSMLHKMLEDRLERKRGQ